MKKSGVTVYWYERDTGLLHSHYFASMPNSGSYEHEVNVKYARDPARIVTVFDSGQGYDGLERLRADALSYQQSLNPTV